MDFRAALRFRAMEMYVFIREEEAQRGTCDVRVSV
jgi:hypothetical protein